MPNTMTGLNSMGQVDDGSFSKNASAAVSAIAEMYKQAHMADPGGPLASQLQMLLDAVADAEGEYMGSGSAAAAAGGPDQAVPMPGDEAMADPQIGGGEVDPAIEAQMAGPEPQSFDEAGSQLETMGVDYIRRSCARLVYLNQHYTEQRPEPGDQRSGEDCGLHRSPPRSEPGYCWTGVLVVN